MIIPLLVLIFLAILFPGFVRGMLLVICLGVGYVLLTAAGTRPTDTVEAASRSTPQLIADRTDDGLSVMSDPISPQKSRPANDEVSARIKREIAAYAAAKGETVAAFAARIGSNPSKIEAFVYASEKGGTPGGDALAGLEALGTSVRSSSHQSSGIRLPTYDINQECTARLAKVAASQSKALGLPLARVTDMYVEKCVRDEQSDFNALSEVWPEVASAVRSDCIAFAEGPRMSSFNRYFALRQCVESK